MPNLGGAEILVILLIALLVLGPDKLPGAARSVGKGLSQLRRLSSGFEQEVRSAMGEADRAGETGSVPASTGVHPGLGPGPRLGAGAVALDGSGSSSPSPPPSASPAPTSPAGEGGAARPVVEGPTESFS